ncbi:MAG: YdcF family protein [Fervidobacterium sp.]
MLSQILKFVSTFIILPGFFVTIFSVLAYFIHRNITHTKNTLGKDCVKVFRYMRTIFFSLALLIYLISTNWFAHVLTRLLYIPDTEDKGEYVVILGGGIDKYQGTIEIGKHTLRRLLKGFQLYKTRPRKIIVTGGAIGINVSEGSIMKKVLTQMGIPEEDIIVEEFAKNTFENAKYTKKLLLNSSITIVTSVSHMRRSLWVFKRFFNEVYHVNADITSDFKNFYLDYLPTFNGFYSTCQVVYELLGILQYKILYRGAK